MTSDAFDIDSVDKRFVSNPAPEPFGQLLPGEQIKAGDIVLNLEHPNPQWQWVEGQNVGMAAPKRDVVYARVQPPEGMRMLRDDDQEVIAGDCRWDGMQWVSFERNMTIAEAKGIAGADTGGAEYIARQGDAIFHVEVPAHHRLLWIGDSVRFGDKLSITGDTRWQKVDASMRGHKVEAPSVDNAFARFIRPVSLESCHWYVDGEKGKAVANGSTDEPFDTIQNATKMIEATYRQAGKVPQGVIWNTEGVPLMAYDPPEPEGDGKTGATIPTGPTVSTPSMPTPMFEEPSPAPPVGESAPATTASEKSANKVEVALRTALQALRDAEEAVETARAAVRQCLDQL